MRDKHLFCHNYFKGKQFREIELPQDASPRKYSRIIVEDSSYILMDCPPSEIPAMKLFVDIAKFLTENNFSAPKIYQEDTSNGFLLLEDFGDCHLRKYIEHNIDCYTIKKDTYCLIIDLLIQIQNIQSPNYLLPYAKETILNEFEVFTDWYIRLIKGKDLTADEKREFLALCDKVLSELPSSLPNVTILKDYHVENMLLLPRDGTKSIGLLDFQDAVIGNQAYDLSALLTDARIEVPLQLANECLEYYISKHDKAMADDIRKSYHILTVSNNTRILGFFARKKLRDNNSNYLKYLSRVLRYIENSLNHPSLSEMKAWYKNNGIIE